MHIPVNLCCVFCYMFMHVCVILVQLPALSSWENFVRWADNFPDHAIASHLANQSKLLATSAVYFSLKSDPGQKLIRSYEYRIPLIALDQTACSIAVDCTDSWLGLFNATGTSRTKVVCVYSSHQSICSLLMPVIFCGAGLNETWQLLWMGRGCFLPLS